MAIEKNTASTKNGEVTHKMIIETSEGNFAVSLFSNNEVHQDFAEAFGDGSNILNILGAIATSVKIVKNEAAPKDESRLARLAALKTAP